jgi:DNA primase
MNIETIVESYGIELKQQGKLLIGFCPFHSDMHNPNLTVYPRTNSWFCYACNKGGDVLQFISLMENVERSEIKKRLSLDILKHKLNVLRPREQMVTIDFRSETLYLLSAMFYNFLVKNPHKLDPAMDIMARLDACLNTLESISYSDSVELVEKLKNYLYNI